MVEFELVTLLLGHLQNNLQNKTRSLTSYSVVPSCTSLDWFSFKRLQMTGPPTPPATSPVELQDKARSGSNSTVQTAPQQSPSESYPDIYHRALPGIIDSIQRSNYNALVNMAEQIDFTVNPAFDLSEYSLTSNTIKDSW